MRVRLVGVVALMALVVASCGGGVSEAAGPSEGIQVHGDWTLDIYNEDGTLDEHVEFSNDLTEGGEAFLAAVVGRTRSPGPWGIILHSGLCSAGTCNIVEPNWAGRAQSENLVVEVVAGPPATVKLTGSVVVDEDGFVIHVNTFNETCVPTTGPSECAGSTTEGGYLVTATAPPDPPEVSAGQTVQVEVILSFTSG